MKPRRLSIRVVVLSLLVFAMMGTFIGSLISSVIVNKKNLENNYLIENQFYAQKLADTTDHLFSEMLQNLKTEAEDPVYLSNKREAIGEKLQALVRSTNFFNSVFFSDQTGHLVNVAPDISKSGAILSSDGPQEAIKRKIPLISEPYMGIIGKMMILISVPVFDENHEYVGFLGGTIYLHENNSLKAILGQQPQHKNDSYVFVVDTQGNIIYHPNPERINDNVIENKMVQRVIKGERGHQVVVNTQGVEMLAGYAPLKSASKWGIISQTPSETTLKPTIEVVKRTSLITIPFILFVFFISLLLLKKIVHPIRELATYAKRITEKQPGSPPHIPDKLFELVDLKNTILIAVDYYEKKVDKAENKSLIDPLTNLYNRRALDRTIVDLSSYSIILFDLDRFKEVNDRYGHQVGDEVLLFLTDVVRRVMRTQDSCIRLGGDEFLIILPETDVTDAVKIAEALMLLLESSISPTGKTISISIGVGHYPSMAKNFSDLYKLTDEAQYAAKQGEQDKIVVARE